MEEVFDIPHAYPLLLAYVLKGHPEVDKAELERYKQEVWTMDRADDIYCHILEEAGIDPKSEVQVFDERLKRKRTVTARDAVKTVVQMWIYLDSKKKRFAEREIERYEAVASFYETHFPTIAQAVYDWPFELKDYIDSSFTITKKPIKKICHSFQQVERRVSIHLCSLLKVPYQPLFDAIFVRKRDCKKLQERIDFIGEMRKVLEENNLHE